MILYARSIRYAECANGLTKEVAEASSGAYPRSQFHHRVFEESIKENLFGCTVLIEVLKSWFILIISNGNRYG